MVNIDQLGGIVFMNSLLPLLCAINAPSKRSRIVSILAFVGISAFFAALMTLRSPQLISLVGATSVLSFGATCFTMGDLKDAAKRSVTAQRLDSAKHQSNKA